MDNTCKYLESTRCKSPYYRCPKEICCKICGDMLCETYCEHREPMRYVSIPEFVTAEVYRPGLEDGWVLPWSEFFENHISYFRTQAEAEVHTVDLLGESYADLIVETPVPYIGNKRDNSMVRPGDFILTHADNSRTVMGAEEFHRKFKEVK